MTKEIFDKGLDGPKSQDAKIIADFKDLGPNEDGLGYLKKNMHTISVSEATKLIPAVQEVKPISDISKELQLDVLQGLQEKINAQDEVIANQRKKGEEKEAQAKKRLVELEKTVEGAQNVKRIDDLDSKIMEEMIKLEQAGKENTDYYRRLQIMLDERGVVQKTVADDNWAKRAKETVPNATPKKPKGWLSKLRGFFGGK